MIHIPTRENSILGLGDQIRQYGKVINKRIDYVHRNLSIMLFTGILYGTPVDTGQARGGWHPSKNSPVMGAAGPRLDPTGRQVAQEIQEVCMSAKFKDILFFVNTTEYIIPLEYGWSQKQAPEGMVRINLARVRRMVSEVIASAREVR